MANSWLQKVFVAVVVVSLIRGVLAADWEQGWDNPPPEARLRAYWWWLNGNVTAAAITRDLEQMKAKGFGGALLCDAGGASQDGNATVAPGPTFFSPQWRELYRHCLREAERLNLEISLNIQSGWNLGGPMVPIGDAPKKLIWSETNVTGPAPQKVALPEPKHKEKFYHDICVLAVPARHSDREKRRPLQNLAEKALLKPLHFSAPDTTPLLLEGVPEPGEEDAKASEVVDLTSKLDANGQLQWTPPAGNWAVLRFGYTVGDHARVSTCSPGWDGYAVDVLDRHAFKRYADAVVEPLLRDAGPLAGKTLKFLHTDSWEIEVVSWTPRLRAEFRTRRGYDLLPYLPVLAGKIIDGRLASHRFLHDFRKTIGDLAVDEHYVPFRDLARKYGLLLHPESGGPHAVPIDAQRCLGFSDAPMSEFWAWSWRHRVGDANRFFVKQPASAAHTYGRRLVLAEGFTTIGPHWQETLWDNLKPAFDHACCEGLNRLVWHAFVCSPAEAGIPGQQYFAGTHLNPNVTWWEKSPSFFLYLNRCQHLLQQGLFVADVCYYYGDHVPNFAQLRSRDPAKLGSGYDYDVITEEAVLERLTVKQGRLVLPDGMSYRMLVLADHPAISLPVLKKVRELVRAGATIVGKRPTTATGWHEAERQDADVQKIAAELWGGTTGKGTVLDVPSGREALTKLDVLPDFETAEVPTGADVEYIHRRTETADIYFVANRAKQAAQFTATFRVADKAPELWNAVTGERRFATAYRAENGRTTVPLELGPCGSVFVVFRKSATAPTTLTGNNSPAAVRLRELSGAWQVQFDPKWGGPASATFAKLESWTKRAEPGIKYYSGTATYQQKLQVSAAELSKSLALDLGEVHELAEVRLNGKSLGVVWAPPFRVKVPVGCLQAGDNKLEIEVVNFWPNRIIGDQTVPEGKRLTKTNIRKLTKDTPLVESGLLGPVELWESP